MERLPNAGAQSPLGLAGKIALVTGASRGIGAAVARALGAAGASVVVGTEPRPDMVEAAGRVASEIEAHGVQAKVVSADVGDETATTRMFEQAVTAFDRIDVFVANAARLSRVAYSDLTREEWDATLAVNATGVHLGAREAAKHMSEGASIITIGSIVFALGTNGSVPYVASKGAVVGLTRALARQLGPRGIRVNCVAPGAIRTESEKELYREVDDDAVIEQQCLPRRGEPSDVAGAVVFLASPLSGFITGQVLQVDGGWVF